MSQWILLIFLCWLMCAHVVFLCCISMVIIMFFKAAFIMYNLLTIKLIYFSHKSQWLLVFSMVILNITIMYFYNISITPQRKLKHTYITPYSHLQPPAIPNLFFLLLPFLGISYKGSHTACHLLYFWLLPFSIWSSLMFLFIAKYYSIVGIYCILIIDLPVYGHLNYCCHFLAFINTILYICV